MSLILDLYNLAASYASKENTLQYLNDFNYKTKETYALEHLMMLGRQRNVNDFENEAIALNVKNKNLTYKTMLRRIIRHALVFMPNIEYKHRQRLISKFFPGADEKKMYLERLQNTQRRLTE